MNPEQELALRKEMELLCKSLFGAARPRNRAEKRRLRRYMSKAKGRKLKAEIIARALASGVDQ